MIVGLLPWGGADSKEYLAGARFLNFPLGPAVVALAVPLYGGCHWHPWRPCENTREDSYIFVFQAATAENAPEREQHVLDVACGPGYLAAAAAHAGRQSRTSGVVGRLLQQLLERQDDIAVLEVGTRLEIIRQ